MSSILVLSCQHCLCCRTGFIRDSVGRFVACVKQRCNETRNGVLRSQAITVVMFYELLCFEMFKY